MAHMTPKHIFKVLVLFLIITLGISFYLPIDSESANWINLPPYNTLWPLWSPPLSPTNPLTGLPTPIVSSLESTRVLPVQPGLTWDPRRPYPWLLYYVPPGLVYYDPLYGINPWPPAYLKDPLTGLPAPINLSLIKGWSLLAPTATSWLTNNVPVANNAFVAAYPPSSVATTPPLTSLLTASLILGLGPILP